MARVAVRSCRCRDLAPGWERADPTVPEAVIRATLKRYRYSDAVADLMEFPDRGHSLTVDPGWREVADGRRRG